MLVQLMLTCLCDAFYGEVGIATVKLLEGVGCEVIFDERQTCCGQPPFNAGDWKDSRKIAEHCRSVFNPEIPIVIPSGSCAAMLRDGYHLLFPEAKRSKAFELSEFLAKEIGLEKWPAQRSYDKRIAFHRACHGRVLALGDTAEKLLTSIPGLQLMPVEASEQCCGFGGAFSATQGKLSSDIGLEKLRTLKESGAEEVVSGDMGCLMHLTTLAERNSFPMRFRHFAEVLAEVL